MKAAVADLNLSAVDSSKPTAAVEAAGGSLDFEGWKKAINEAGGKAFTKAIERYVGADGKVIFSARVNWS
jgi:hypothetical protein